MKVLAIGTVWPEPNSSAAGRHLLSLLRLFQEQDWQIEFASSAKPSPFQSDLASEGFSCQSIRLNCDSFDDYIKALHPDLVLFDRFMTEEQFGWRVEQHCPKALRLLDTEDLHCLRFARHQAVKQGRPLHVFDLNNDLAKREIAAILRSDLSLIISPFEARLLQYHFGVPADLLHQQAFMLDLSALPQHHLFFEERQHFISIGNFKHAPNWDAVLQLKQLWPAIHRQLPEAECHIYGAYLPPKAQNLHNEKQGFIIQGRAEDALTVMANARVCLAPLSFGAGQKGKLLEAFITHTPSVTTSIGAEGMAEQMVWPGLVADSRSGFIDAAIALYRDEALWCDKQSNAQPILKQYYDKQQTADVLIDKINQLRKQLTRHRQSHFHSAMLRHHHLASTRYFSQWIQAKNS